MAFFCGDEAGWPDSRLIECGICESITCGGTTREGINASGGRGWSGRDGGYAGCGIGWCGCVGTVVPGNGGPGG